MNSRHSGTILFITALMGIILISIFFIMPMFKSQNKPSPEDNSDFSSASSFDYMQDNRLWHDFAVLPSGKMIMIAKNGIISVSEDKGENWRKLNSGTKSNLISICAVNEEKWFILSRKDQKDQSEGFLLTTENGGISFTEQKLPCTASAISFDNEGKGRIIDESGTSIYITYSSGTHWDRVSTPFPVKSIYFTNSKEGWAAGKGGIIRTADGGRTWTSSLGAPDADLSSICFYDQTTGAAAGKDLILTTSDGGATWRRSFDHKGYNLAAVGFSDSKTIIAAGGDGKIIKSADSGKTWDNRESNIYNNFNRILFTSDKTGWIAGQNGIVLTTRNGGDTWLLQKTPSSIYWGIYFTDKYTGFAAGSSTALVWTNEAGRSWHDCVSLKDRYGARVSFSGRNEGWLCCYDPAGGKMVALSSSDAGMSWSEKSPPQKGQIMDIFTLPGGNAMAAGFISSENETLTAAILSTSDGGNTWKTSYSDSEGQFNSIYLIDNINGWAAGTLGNDNSPGSKADIIKLSGGTWNRCYVKDNQDLNDIFFADKNNGWAVGEEINPDSGSSSGLILRTTDGGTTWKSYITGAGEHMNSVFFINPQKGWVSGNGKVYETSDGGNSWSVVFTDPGADLTGVFFVDPQNGWIIGTSGIISFKRGSSVRTDSR